MLLNFKYISIISRVLHSFLFYFEENGEFESIIQKIELSAW